MPETGNNIITASFPTISIRYKPGGFCFLESPSEMISAGELESQCLKTAQLNEPNQRVLILEYAPNFLVLPKELDPSYFFKFHFPNLGEPNVKSLLLSDQKQQLVFDISPKHQRIYEQFFPQSQLICLPLCFVEYVLNQSRTQAHCLIYIHQDLLMVFAAKNGVLSFANRFDITSEEDAAYFVLSIHHVFETGSCCSLCTESSASERVSTLLSPHFEHIDTYLLDKDIKLFLSAVTGQLVI